MDNADLAALVPGIMTRHPRHTWTARLGEGAVPRLTISVKPDQLPDRMAKVTIYPGSEVYFLDFAGHTVTDYAYEPDEKPELLQDMLDLAVTVTAGPTQITLDLLGSTVVRWTGYPAI